MEEYKITTPEEKAEVIDLLKKQKQVTENLIDYCLKAYKKLLDKNYRVIEKNTLKAKKLSDAFDKAWMDLKKLNRRIVLAENTEISNE